MKPLLSTVGLLTGALLISSLAGCQSSDQSETSEDQGIEQFSAQSPTLSEEYAASGGSQTEQADTSSEFSIESSASGNPATLSELFEQATSSIILAEGQPPEWLEQFLAEYRQAHRFQSVHFLSGTPVYSNPAYNFFIPDLKDSFLIIDQECVVLNILYNITDTGLSYQACGETLAQHYLDFAINNMPQGTE